MAIQGIQIPFEISEKSVKGGGCLGCIGDYTTQLCGDHDDPLQGSLLNNQYNGK